MVSHAFILCLFLLLANQLSLSAAQYSYYGYGYYSYYYYYDSCNNACFIATTCFMVLGCCCCTGCSILLTATVSAFILKFAYSKGKKKGKKSHHQQQQEQQQQPMYQPGPTVPAPQFYPGYPQPVQTAVPMQTAAPIPMGQVYYPPPLPHPQ